MSIDWKSRYEAECQRRREIDDEAFEYSEQVGKLRAALLRVYGYSDYWHPSDKGFVDQVLDEVGNE